MDTIDRPRLTWDVLLALTNDAGHAGRTLRSVAYGMKGCVDVWRRRGVIREDHQLSGALALALRTGCDSRDIVALKRCGGGELAALRGIVPRARRAEYRDWNNCAVAAERVNDKLECGRRLRDAGIEVAPQIPLGPETVFAPGAGPGALEFFHPSVPAGTWWMVKDRYGLQGESVWVGKACGAAPPVRNGAGTDETAAGVGRLAQSGRLMAEELLRPQKWFAEAGDSALPTVRVVTSRLRARTEVVGLVLFRGGPGAVAANRKQGGLAHTVAENGSCGDGIDREGRNRGPCHYRFPKAYATRLHRMCVEAHELFPCVGSVGWDVGLSSRGPVLLEGNPNWGMNVPQLMPGRAMLEEFRRTGFRDSWYGSGT